MTKTPEQWLEEALKNPNPQLTLQNELDKLMAEQASGVLDKPQEGETEEAFNERVRLRIKTGMLAVAELRKSHTGPPAASGTKGKGKKPVLSSADIQALEAEMLK